MPAAPVLLPPPLLEPVGRAAAVLAQVLGAAEGSGGAPAVLCNSSLLSDDIWTPPGRIRSQQAAAGLPPVVQHLCAGAVRDRCRRQTGYLSCPNSSPTPGGAQQQEQRGWRRQVALCALQRPDLLLKSVLMRCQSFGEC